MIGLTIKTRLATIASLEITDDACGGRKASRMKGAVDIIALVDYDGRGLGEIFHTVRECMVIFRLIAFTVCVYVSTSVASIVGAGYITLAVLV